MRNRTLRPDIELSAFVDFLRERQLSRFYLVWDDDAGRVVTSHPDLEPLAGWLSAEPCDFDRHEGIFAELAPRSGALISAAVHRTCRGQGAGGVRNWSYDTLEAFVRDGLRLSRGMSHKNALAGLWWGGGKGVMARNTGADLSLAANRRTLYEDYGAFITSLRGIYVTAEDVGTSVEDMRAVFSQTRFSTCIPESVGGSGNPSVPTALGVVRGMEAALAHLGLGSLEGKRVAVQGLGHVGGPLVQLLLDRAVAHVVGADVDEQRVRDAAELGAGRVTARHVPRGDTSILAEAVDIVAPCATGGILNPTTIPTLKARVVCGAANNQLGDPQRDDERLQAAGILYAPDFLVNRMGIVNCADEQFGYVDDDPSFTRHLGETWDNSIYRLARQVFADAETQKQTPAQVAQAIAEQRSLEPHPLTGHRGPRIIRSLLQRGWAREGGTAATPS